jgi:hypothetical protein
MYHLRFGATSALKGLLMSKWKDAGTLLLLTFAALLIHGYHPYAEDAEIYLPGIEKKLDPSLFPANTQFFLSHANATWFPGVVASSIRLTRLPFETALFCWHLLSIFLFLWALWELSCRCFTDRTARWAGVCLVGALFTLPVAGTALYIIDQYFNPRNLTASLGLFCLVKVLDRKYMQACLLLIVTGGLHPLMMVFVFATSFLFIAFDWAFAEGRGGTSRVGIGRALLAAPFGLTFDPPPASYHQVAASHRYHYLLRWEWYEWLGALAPIAILAWFSRLARRNAQRKLDLLCRALVVLVTLSVLAALVLSASPRFESLARIQPLRSLHLVYILMFLFAGCFLGEYVLRGVGWRWLVLFLPLCGGMYLGQRALFPASPHIELPGVAPRNPWAQAFRWVRANTPKDALFALDPYHMAIEGEDAIGFRALAERSMLADGVKDSGAVTMFPPMADAWLRQYNAQKDWKHFQLSDFERLKAEFGVTWVVVQQPGVSGLECPYQNSVVLVCRLP